METFVKGVGSGQSHQMHGNHMAGGCGEERANGYWVSLTVLVPRKLMVQNVSLQNILWWHIVAVVVWLVSHADSLRPHGLQHARLPLSFTISWSLLRLMSIESVMPSNHLILCRPLLLPPSFFPSIKVFSSELILHIRWPKYWSFSFSINSSNEYSGVISFRMDWLDLFAVQGTLKGLLQHHSSKASILWCSAFFTVQLSHPYMTTGKPIALTIWTFVGKVISAY